MRKIINSTYISLDGVIEEPHLWPALPKTGDGTATKVQTELIEACDAVLMGRRTYEVFAPVWQTRSGDPVSDRMNSMKKYVVSSTLRDPDWENTTVFDRDVVEEIRRIKEQPGQDIVQYGFGDVSFALLEAGLLDELRLWVYPQIIGRGGIGELLFRETTPTTLRLLDTMTLANDIVILSYAFD